MMPEAKSLGKLLTALLLLGGHVAFGASVSNVMMGEHGYIRGETADETVRQERIEFSCPSHIPEAANADENQKEWYDAISAEIAEDVTGFLETFREKEEYDNWGHSYDQVKDKYSAFKSKYFAPNLADGSSIYESASGIGLNLLMTLEILEEHGLGGLVVYGNEYVKDSVEVATQILGSHELPGNAQLGNVCQADSSNLQHVPSDAFDLVFTGYITPMMNPLGLDIDRHEIYTAYADLCGRLDEDTEEEAREKVRMSQLAQERQEEWYRDWVAEMIRIAKPGAPVIIEQVSFPKCQNFLDWGGVDYSFWKAGMEKHGWDIDPNSLEFEHENVFGSRYHVFMRKNSQTSDVLVA